MPDRERRETVRDMLAELAEAGVFVSPWMLSEAAASVRLDREGDGQTFALETTTDPEEGQ